MNFIEKLAYTSQKNRSLLCVGLDPDPALMPENIGVFEFNKAIIDATVDVVCAYKPNIAFYEAMGNAGQVDLEDLNMLAKIVLSRLASTRPHLGPVPTPTPGFEIPKEDFVIYR